MSQTNGKAVAGELLADKEQVEQLLALVAAREDQLRRDELLRAAQLDLERDRDMHELRQCVAGVLHGLGVPWLWAHGGEVKREGTWEQCCELKSIAFTVPRFRPFALFVGKWQRIAAEKEQRGTLYQQWQPAAWQTGEEVSSWVGKDVSGLWIACDTFTEALCVAMIRNGVEELLAGEGVQS